MPSYTGPKKPNKPAPKRKKKAMPAKTKGSKTKMLTSSRRGN